MSKDRIYKGTIDGKEQLVRAGSRGQAFRALANKLVKVEVASQMDCVKLGAIGILEAAEPKAEATAPANGNKKRGSKTPGELAAAK